MKTELTETRFERMKLTQKQPSVRSVSPAQSEGATEAALATELHREMSAGELLPPFPSSTESSPEHRASKAEIERMQQVRLVAYCIAKREIGSLNKARVDRILLRLRASVTRDSWSD